MHPEDEAAVVQNHLCVAAMHSVDEEKKQP